MSMHHGMDLSRFKKIASDKKSTTLRHPKGHEIRIAHAGVTPKMKEALDGLEFAEGGPVTVENGATGPAVEGGAMDPESPAIAPDTPADVPASDAAPAPQAAGQAAPAPAGAGSSIAGPNQQKSEAAPLPTENGIAQASQNPQSTPEPNPTADYLAGKTSTGEYLGGGQPPPADPVVPPEHAQAAIANNMAQDVLKFQQDLASGHIKPKTYGDILWGKKDTLGKIGSLFGLLLSGAGSGLAHQPNAVLEMMNKQIANDLEAQKANQLNDQSWYRLTFEHQKQLADTMRAQAEADKMRAEIGEIPNKIKRTGAEADLLGAQAKAVPGQMERTAAEVRAMDTENKIKSAGLAQMYMTSAAFQHIVDMANGLPEGPAKQQAQQAIGLMYPTYQKEIMDQATHNAGMLNQFRSLYGIPTTASGSAGPIDYGRMQGLILQGQKKLPGGMTEQDRGFVEKEAEKVEENRAMSKNFFGSFDALDKMVGAGVLDPMTRKAHINMLAAQMARQSAGRYNENEAASLVDGMFPSPLDSKQARALKRKNAAQYFTAEEAGTPTLNYFHLKDKYSVPDVETGGMYSNPFGGEGAGKNKKKGGADTGGTGGGSNSKGKPGNIEVSFPTDPTQNSGNPDRKAVTGMPFKDGDTGTNQTPGPNYGRKTVWKNGKWEWK